MRHQHARIGFMVTSGEPERMLRAHSHDEIELNYVYQGRLRYSFGGRTMDIEAGELVAFWAAVPHELTQTQRPLYTCVTLPLATFLQWELPARFVQTLLHGEPAFARGGEVVEESVARWDRDARSVDPGVRRALQLEIQAVLLRMAGNAPAGLPVAEPTGIDAMCRVIAERYAEDLDVAVVAQAARMHPNHAMRAFRQATGMTIGAYLRNHRLAHAKRLLATTDLRVDAVAFASGFGSERRLYEVFRDLEGASPARYRRTLRSEGTAFSVPLDV